MKRTILTVKFDKDGLIPVVTTDFKTGEVLNKKEKADKALKSFW